MTLSRSDASRQLEGAGLRAKRALGQNFVVDPNTVRRIARLANIEGHGHVVEIGAGLGSLTLALAETNAQVTAVEVDDSLIPLLTENVGHLDNVRIVHADAMKIHWAELLSGSNEWALVANLPYNVATPLVADILDFVPNVKRMLVMVQKEVGERFSASPSTEAYGALSVKVAFYASARVVGLVPASVFLPRPNVESALVEIVRHPQPLDSELSPQQLFSLVKMGFAKRRKMLRGALAGRVTPEQFDAARIAPTARAEELTVHDWIRLAHVVGVSE
ncbi:MAG: 16S rRNA (adenine(1518)-N(6)/adenine(1519)-N(6))-dimethyltransferase RsmA [Acidimicrobiaceae bacterium]|nr:16S rRNA (adenine(1518)-N(6)/adenine(1519)-N(6))-dimethyltransferase RsmA [Ilumatobacteraceae bacterium]